MKRNGMIRFCLVCLLLCLLVCDGVLPISATPPEPTFTLRYIPDSWQIKIGEELGVSLYYWDSTWKTREPEQIQVTVDMEIYRYVDGVSANRADRVTTLSVTENYGEHPYIYPGDATGGQHVTVPGDCFVGTEGAVVFRAHARITSPADRQVPAEEQQTAECLYYAKMGDDLFLFDDIEAFRGAVCDTGEKEAEPYAWVAFMLCGVAMLLVGILVTVFAVMGRKKERLER